MKDDSTSALEMQVVVRVASGYLLEFVWVCVRLSLDERQREADLF